MANLGPYDPTLAMFREPPCLPNLERLRFLRWLVETRRLEHDPAGPPSGLYAQMVEVSRGR